MAAPAGRNDARIAVLAIGAFVAISMWLIFGTSRQSEPYQPPYSSYSGNAAGLLALYQLLEARGHELSRHLLSEHEYPAGSCVVIADESALNPFKMVVNTIDVRALDLHMQDGGSIVIICDQDMALVSDLEWLLLEQGVIGDEQAAAALGRISGTGRRMGSGTWRGSMDGEVYELSESRPPLLAEVGSIEAADSWSPVESDLVPLLSLESRYGHPTFESFVGMAEYGNGMLVVVRRPEIATNSWIDRADNHRLLLSLIESAAAGRPIVFDEHVHGYNAKRMTAGSLLTGTTGGRLTLLAVLFIVMLYLGLAISPARVHPSKAPPRRQAAEMVLGQASLFKRAGSDRGSLRHIVDGLKHELMKSHDFGRMPRDRELLDWARLNMPQGWRMDPQLEEFLRSGMFQASRQSLVRAASSCDAMRIRIWQRPLG